jgi:hypothetical protein
MLRIAGRRIVTTKLPRYIPINLPEITDEMIAEYKWERSRAKTDEIISRAGQINSDNQAILDGWELGPRRKRIQRPYYARKVYRGYDKRCTQRPYFVRWYGRPSRDTGEETKRYEHFETEKEACAFAEEKKAEQECVLWQIRRPKISQKTKK